jgi:exodeoxyribonuclease V gamma subunit
VVAAGHVVALEIAGFSAKPKDMSLAQYSGRIDRETARAELANLVTLYIDGQRQPLAYHPDLDDGYEPEQNKAFDNLSFRFKPEAYQPHHLMRDPYLVMLLDDAQAPLGEDAPNSPFIAAIDAVSGSMNRAIQPSENLPEKNTSESA